MLRMGSDVNASQRLERHVVIQQISIILDDIGRCWTVLWRREWDSNPRYGFPYTRFPSVRLKPLGHPSARSSTVNIALRARVINSLRVPVCQHILRREL